MNKKTLLYTVILLITILSLNSFGEEVSIDIVKTSNQSKLTNTTLNSYDDLIFQVCPKAEIASQKASLVCKENYQYIELENIEWMNNCYLSKYNLEDINCENIQLQFEYIEKNQKVKLTKNIEISQNTKILGHIINKQDTNGGFSQDPLYTAYGVWVMSEYGSIYKDEIEAALSWLKYNRDDLQKCWPKNDCDIVKTGQILWILEQAGLKDELRIVKDAKIWIQKNQNLVKNAEWTIRLDSDIVYVQDDGICNITHKDNTNVIDMPINNKYETKINISNKETLTINCDEEVQTTILDQYGRIVHSNDQKFLEYNLGDACWGESQFATCKEYSNDNFVKYTVEVDAGLDNMYEDLNVTITNETKLACSVKYGGQIASFNLMQNQSYEYSLLVNQEDDVEVGCDYVAKMTIYDENYIQIVTNTTKNMTYSIKNNCDLTNKYTSCNVGATSLSVAVNKNKDFADNAYNWMLSETKEDVVGKYIKDKSIWENELFILSSNMDDYEDALPIIEWVAFKQNNDGSWGSSARIKENVVETIYGALALNKFNISSSQEIVNDAKKWIKDFEPEEGWGDVEKNSLAFWAIKDQIKPFLKSNPIIITLDKDEVPVNIINPTDFNIKNIDFVITDELKEIVEIEPIAEINKKSFKRIIIKVNSKTESKKFGYLIIKNEKQELSKIPVILKRMPKIDFALPEKITMYGDKSKTKALINSKTNGTFECTVTWDNTLIDKAFKTTNKDYVEFFIEAKEVKRQNRNVTGKIICQKEGNTISQDISLMIDQYSTKPFSISPRSLISIESGKDISFTITNKIDKSINVDIKFDKEPGFFELDNRHISINPNDKENITILNLAPEDLNFSNDFKITVSSLGQEEIIPFRVALVIDDKQKTNFTLIYILLVLGFIITTFWGFMKLKDISNQDKQKNQIRDLINNIRKKDWYKKTLAPLLEKYLEKKYPLNIDQGKSSNELHIDNDMIVAVQFMKTIGKSDSDITEKLKGQGFNDQYISEILKKVKV